MGNVLFISQIFIDQTDFPCRHGGPAVSLFLHQNLHGLFESVHKSQIPEMYEWTKELGGYFKRYRGGVLQPWLRKNATNLDMDLEARATLAFLEVSTGLPELIHIQTSL